MKEGWRGGGGGRKENINKEEAERNMDGERMKKEKIGLKLMINEGTQKRIKSLLQTQTFSAT